MSICGSSTTSTKRLQVDATSLADLKAELHRKKGEATKNRQQGNYRPEKVRETKTNIWSKENTGLIARMQKDLQKKKEDEFAEERAKLQLEKKARLYDSLKKGKGRSSESVTENFLVNFSANPDDDSDEDFIEDREYPADSKDEEWVEYVDALGRTRKCMRKDLPKQQRQVKDLVREATVEKEGGREGGETGQGLRKEAPDLMDEQTRLDMLRQKWEEQEMENLAKNDIHYSDIRFDEARTHGAGFYNFSNDESKREGEQSTLKKLHEETDAMRRKRERKAESRKRAMDIRIKKVRAKRRAMAGLPPEEENSDDELDEKADYNSDDDDDKPLDINKSVMDGLKLFRSKADETTERQLNADKRVAGSIRREWDEDKEAQQEDDAPRREWRVMDQREWVSKKRVERPGEFAPPSSYDKGKSFDQQAYIQAKTALMQKEQEAKAMEEKRKKFNANSWKDGIGGGPGPIRSAPPPSYRKTPPPANQKFPSNVPPGFDGPPGTEDTSLMPPPPSAPPRGPPVALMSMDLPRPQELPEEEEDEEEQGCMIGPPAPSEESISSQPSSSHNWGVPAAGYGSYQGPAQSQGPRPSPLPQDRAETMPSFSKDDRLALHKRMQEQDFLPPATRIRNEIEEGEGFSGDDDDDEDDEEERKRSGRGAEVAPPCDMGYYGASQGRGRGRGGFRSHEDMADAFSAGMKAQEERKK